MNLSNRRNLYGVLLATIIAAAVVVRGDGVLRVLLSLLLAFVLPGYALVFAWFPRRLQQTPQAVLFNVSLSLAVIVTGGLLLHVTPWGLHPETWAGWLGGITLVHAGIALLRRPNSNGLQPQTRRIGLRPQHGLLFGLAAVLFGAALFVARVGALQQPRAGFTQLWIDEAAAVNTVQVGVRNEEGRAMYYRLELSQGDWAESHAIKLEAGTAWEENFLLPTQAEGEVRAVLYDGEVSQKMYRQVSLWLPEAR